MERYFVQGLYFCSFANSIDPLLSSKVVLYELHESNSIPNTLDTYIVVFFNGIKYHMLWLRLIYSDSVVNKAIYVCILRTQTISKIAILIMYTVLDRTYRNWSASSLHHDPEKSALA